MRSKSKLSGYVLGFSVLIFLSFFLTTPAYSWWHHKWHNLSDIVSPTSQQTLDYHPVEIIVQFHQSARPETFRAWLNHREITNRFEPTGNGVRALVLPEDGLKHRFLGKRGFKWQKTNLLQTSIRGLTGARDLDTRVFSVEYYPVKTTRDERGVWYITGGSLYDVLEAQGYAVATDRLWQAELYRRQGKGKLSEIMGSSMLGTDIYLRTYSYSEAELKAIYNSLDRESRLVLKAYVDGFNRRVAEVLADDSLLPYEFKALGFVPDWWEVTDVMSWMMLLQRNFDSEGTKGQQVSNAALFQGLQAKFPADYLDMFDDLRWINDPDALTYIPPEDGLGLTSAALGIMEAAPAGTGLPDLRQAAEEMAQTHDNVVESLKKINAYVKLGSYAWVVAGSKTESGNPIIYSGPQMGFSTPSIVLEGSIRGGGLNVSGVTSAAIPLFYISRTPHHAISMQVAHAHTVDYYIEDAADVFLHRTEIIKVRGQADVPVPIYRTSHGPVIYPMPYNPSSPSILSWKYAYWGKYEFLSGKAALGFARATSMDEFAAAVEDYPVSLHVCYADRDGNIAYWQMGRDPVRPAGVETRLPQLGDGSQEWPEPVTLKPRSTDRNTPKGFYSGWNNKSNPNYDNMPATMYGPFHRAHVIDDYLSAHDNLTFEDIRDLALNIATTNSWDGGGNPWKFVAEDFTKAVTDAGPNSEREAALALLAAWDGHWVAGGPSEWALGTDVADAWVLMNDWIREVIRLTFDDELAGLNQGPGTLFNVLLHGLAGSESGVVNKYNWFQNLQDAGAPQTPEAIIVQALDTVLAALGDPPWGIGERGVITYRHDLLGPVHTTPLSQRSTYAHCVEFGPSGPVRIESMFPLGESGTILGDPPGAPVFDPHFFSMVPVYDDFSHRPFPLFD